MVAIALLLLSGVFDPSPARAENVTAQTANENDFNPFAPCPKCKLLVGAGATYQFWGWSDGTVLPVTLELDESRWELGAFRVASRQVAIGHGYPPPDYTSAPPFWGFSAMRRWQFLHRSWLRLYAGIGGSFDVLPRPQGRGFLLQDGDVPPRACSLRHSRCGRVLLRIRCISMLLFQGLRYL
jgi:hypothetical protein